VKEIPKIRPEDTYEMIGWASDAEQVIGSVPSDKYARKVYSIVAVHHTPNTTGWFALRKYKGATLESEVKFVLGAFDTLDLSRPLDWPILTYEAGREVRTIAGAPTSIQLVLSYYDL